MNSLLKGKGRQKKRMMLTVTVNEEEIPRD
jgi:hypothetical protein